MRALLVMLVPGLAIAQFGSFATNGDGSVLYFSSDLVLRDAQDPEHGKIYRVDSSGVKLVFKRERIDPPPPSSPGDRSPRFTNPYHMYAVQVSRDGERLAIVSSGSCIGGPACGIAQTGRVEVGDSSTLTFGASGYGFLSRNGRYLLAAPLAVFGGVSLSLVDFQSGNSETTEGAPIPRYAPYGQRRSVADNGAAVFADGGAPLLIHGGRIEPLPDSGASSAAIDAEARTIVYTRGYPGALRVMSLPDKKVTEIARFPNGVASPEISADGGRVMFLAQDLSRKLQVWAIDTAGSNLRQVTKEPFGVVQATMSDDGKKIWFHSFGGAVFQVDIDSGVTVERIGRTPNFYSLSSMAPGSAATIRGWGVRDDAVAATGFPLPIDLGGTRVKVKGFDAPLLRVTPTEITFQAPWETPPSVDVTKVEVELESNTSPFKFGSPRTSGQILATREAIVKDSGDYYALAVHEDWSAIVDEANPARPGEIIHLYGTGFGPVVETPATGMPPANRSQSSTVERVKCDRPLLLNAIDVLYSGLAPGTVGYYQIDIRVPTDAVAPSMSFTCRASMNFGASGYLRIGR